MLCIAIILKILKGECTAHIIKLCSTIYACIKNDVNIVVDVKEILVGENEGLVYGQGLRQAGSGYTYKFCQCTQGRLKRHPELLGGKACQTLQAFRSQKLYPVRRSKGVIKRTGMAGELMLYESRMIKTWERTDLSKVK